MKIKIGKRIDESKMPAKLRTNCPNCVAETKITATEMVAVLQVIDNKGKIAKRVPAGMKHWPRGPMAFTIYFCSNCTAAMVMWSGTK